MKALVWVFHREMGTPIAHIPANGRLLIFGRAHSTEVMACPKATVQDAALMPTIITQYSIVYAASMEMAAHNHWEIPYLTC